MTEYTIILDDSDIEEIAVAIWHLEDYGRWLREMMITKGIPPEAIHIKR